jgi:hypothetical protein
MVTKHGSLVVVEQIEPHILLLRGQRVILDAHLAELYGTTTKRLNEQVRRNQGRFPSDFMFQLAVDEVEAMRSQIVTTNLRSQNATSSSARHGGRRYLPYAFTEHGALMAASILNTPRAMEVSVYVIRAFVRLRELLSTHKELAGKLGELERKVSSHDVAIQSLVTAIRQLMAPPPTSPQRKIGFHVKPEGRS